jgi:uncharacterized coiled-coil DUF342 family protein
MENTQLLLRHIATLGKLVAQLTAERDEARKAARQLAQTTKEACVGLHSHIIVLVDQLTTERDEARRDAEALRVKVDLMTRGLY